MGFALSVGITSSVAVAHQRYSDRSLFNIPLQTEAVEGHTWTGEGISFHQLDGDHFDVSFNLSGDQDAQLVLRDIDLTLMIPEVPVTAQGNPDLTRWFLTEREFNRQRVIFEPGSTHIDLPDGLDGYNAEDLSIALTNNCLGAGYWELAVSAPNGEGELEKIYQGYFTFPRGVYAEIVSWLNPSSYWQQARTMEAWPGFDFLSGLPFALSELRTVDAETVVPVTDLKTEEIIAKNEQIKKESLIVYADGTDADDIRTWEDIRQADLRFQSFVTPGIYDESRLWESDFSQLKTVVSAVGRQITSPLADVPFSDEANVEDISVTDSQQQALVEVELDFESEAGELRRLVVSGIDWAQVPQLESVDYSDGVYMPLGFGTPFTQSYGDLQETPPAQSPFFSVFLDADNRVIDYRQDIGVNGLVMHRDVDDPDLLHLYLMSYERITLIGHYVVDLDMYELPQY
ncbi:MAG: hypothetical protein AAF635_07510 [Cyanobacteria bacterium P01_C01_bin.69]